MPSLVISSDTISVNLESNHLELIKRTPKDDTETEKIRIKVPLFDIERVLICGRPNISIPVLQRLMKNGIPTFFTSSRGRWIGSLLPDNNMNAERRIRQYELARNSDFSLMVASKLVYAKIRNCRRVLQRLAANRNLANESEHILALNRLE